MLPAPTLRSPGLVVWHVHAAEMQRFDDARGAGRVSAVGQSNPHSHIQYDPNPTIAELGASNVSLLLMSLQCNASTFARCAAPTAMREPGKKIVEVNR